MDNRIAAVLAAVFVAVLAAAAPRPARAQCDAPSLLLILDKSSSMITDRVPSGISKWEAARRAVTAITSRFEDSISFGLLVFPDPDRCDVIGVQVDVGPATAAEIGDYLETPPPTSGNYTPMARALDVAAAYPPMSDLARRRVAVLVTDGWQWCYPYDRATRFDPVVHAAALRATGTTLWVVGFGGAVDAATLNRIAVDSGTAVPGCDPDDDDPASPAPCYLRAEDTSSLEAALDAIAVRATDELCDGLDNDCDGLTDEDLVRPCTTACGDGSATCREGVWSGCDARTPAPAELCDGVVDDDCDGETDEGCACIDGATRPCGSAVGACVPGTQRCAAGAWDDCAGAVPPAPETCDGLDDDCNGAVDDGAACPPGRACRSGVCVAEDAGSGDAAPEAPADESNGLGCGCTVPGGAGGWGLLGLLVAAVPLLRRLFRRP